MLSCAACGFYAWLPPFSTVQSTAASALPCCFKIRLVRPHLLQLSSPLCLWAQPGGHQLIDTVLPPITPDLPWIPRKHLPGQLGYLGFHCSGVQTPSGVWHPPPSTDAALTDLYTDPPFPVWPSHRFLGYCFHLSLSGANFSVCPQVLGYLGLGFSPRSKALLVW